MRRGRRFASHAGAIALAMLAWGCRGEEAARPAVSTSTTSPAPSTAAPVLPTEPEREPLQKALGALALGMTAADAEAKLGPLTCRDTKELYRICSPASAVAPDVTAVEFYLFHDRVIAITYERPEVRSAWEFLDHCIERYGRPSLSGVNERDRTGRLHEIYGWKDDTSLYSVRFVWVDAPTGARELSTTVIALWDRKAYEEWEAERQPQRPAPAGDGKEPALT